MGETYYETAMYQDPPLPVVTASGATYASLTPSHKCIDGDLLVNVVIKDMKVSPHPPPTYKPEPFNASFDYLCYRVGDFQVTISSFFFSR